MDILFIMASRYQGHHGHPRQSRVLWPPGQHGHPIITEITVSRLSGTSQSTQYQDHYEHSSQSRASKYSGHLGHPNHHGHHSIKPIMYIPVMTRIIVPRPPWTSQISMGIIVSRLPRKFQSSQASQYQGHHGHPSHHGHRNLQTIMGTPVIAGIPVSKP
jgi:hypothetical protein